MSAKTTVEALLAALETVAVLREAAAKHDRVLAALVARVEAAEARLAVLERAGGP